MHVQDIQPKIAANLRHFYGKRQGIIRILEQIVIVYDYGMEKKPRRIHGQAERPLIADEMHLVAAAGEFLAECRGQNATAADRWIAGNAESHGQNWRALPPSSASE